MESIRPGRIYLVVTVIMIIGLLLGAALGGLAGGAVAYYYSQRAEERIMAAVPTAVKKAQPPSPTAVPPTATPAKGSPLTPVAEKIVESSLEQCDLAIQRVYEKVNPAVVFINVAVRSTMPFSPFVVPREPYQYGSGSGFVFDREGHIVTNNHVIAQAEKITVVFADDTSVPATVVGKDPDSDLAVIKVDPRGLELVPVELGDSDTLKVGQRVVAIGSPFGYPGTLTEGVISGLGRSLPAGEALEGGTYTIPEIIQTDAAINPGNSGGPLLDLQGRVIGVNAAIESPVRGSTGVGFAIPVNLVKLVVPMLIEKGSYEYPWLGISGMTINPDIAEAMGLPRNQRGVIVAEVTPNSPADKAGLRPSNATISSEGRQMPINGDVIIAINEYPVSKFEELVMHLIRHTQVGQEIKLTVIRNRQTVTVTVKLAARPKSS